jgi:hypothetical protein
MMRNMLLKFATRLTGLENTECICNTASPLLYCKRLLAGTCLGEAVVQYATRILKQRNPSLIVDGEMQGSI